MEKSIAEKGVVLKHSTMQFTKARISHADDVIVITKPFFAKNSDIDIVIKMIK